MLYFGESSRTYIRKEDRRRISAAVLFLCLCVVFVCEDGEWAGGTALCAAIKTSFDVFVEEQHYLCSSSFRQTAQMFLPLKTEMSLALSQKMQAG